MANTLINEGFIIISDKKSLIAFFIKGLEKNADQLSMIKRLAKSYIQQKNIISLSCVALLLSGCGKPIENSGAADPNVNLNLNAEGSSIRLELDFDQEQSKNKEYQFDQHSKIAIPDSIRVKSGSPNSFDARVYFNIHNDEYDFFCDYQTYRINKSDYQYTFVGCFADIDLTAPGVENLQYFPGQWEFQDKGNSIQIEIQNLDSESQTSIFTDIDVDWH